MGFKLFGITLKTLFQFTSIYRPDVDIDNNYERELGMVFNWFFKEHRNKLSMECTNFTFQGADGQNPSEWRFRLQWDISF
ncbi:hypothetical protein [Xanthomarina gelatinilytica]|uniref:hypothetical protein n=1 Tax=Xanthomarina gelatinilytica TaxID=1137281 RepID=UPI003AA85AEF